MLQDKLFGLRYTVAQDGTLRFSGNAFLYPLKTGGIPYIDVQIPTHVLAQGADFVRAYATSEAEKRLEAIAAQALTAYEERIQRLREACVRIATKHDGIYLKGSVRYADRPGTAVWDVYLEEPAPYASSGTLYHSRNTTRSLVIDAAPSLTALTEAQRTLVELYTQKKHEKAYPLAYALLKQLR